MKEKYETIRPETFLLKYFERTIKVEREDMKKDILSLGCKLAEKNIFSSIDFSGDELYSNKLDRDLWFFMSAGLIEERKGKMPNNTIIYQITRRGLKEMADKKSVFYDGITHRTMKILEDALKDVPRRYSRINDKEIIVFEKYPVSKNERL